MKKQPDYGLILLFIGLIVVLYLSSFLNSEEHQLVSLLKLSPGIIIATTGLVVDIKRNNETEGAN